jgi:hypothetical protein
MKVFISSDFKQKLGLLRDPWWGILAKEYESFSSLRDGGIFQFKTPSNFV